MARSNYLAPVSCLVLLAPFLFLIEFCQGQTHDLRDDQILPTAIDAITANYAKLTTIRAKLYSVILDPKVDKAQIRTFPLEIGGVVNFTEAPRIATRVYFTAKGQDYRHERQGRAVSILQDGVFTQHNFKTNRTQTRPLSESGSMVELDPRTFGGRDQRYGLVELMNESQLISAEFQDGGIVTIETRAEAAAERGRSSATHRYTLDRERNWLPTRVIALHEDGLIATVTEFEYDEVLPNTWFIKQVTTNYAGRYEIREISPEVQWSQTHLVYTFGQPEFNVLISDSELTSLKPFAIEETESDR